MPKINRRLRYLRRATQQYVKHRSETEKSIVNEGVMVSLVVVAAFAWVLWKGHMLDWRPRTVLTNLLPVVIGLGGSLVLIVAGIASILRDIFSDADRIAAIRDPK
ncbi:hypothetical protein KZJ38_07125 [Paraburkholderia edwinii]|uniref:Uncharacterized protein n=1 Tax=Paraburkholderia edwinii TaxID=2861782 RepID=A0ABX8UMZ5_9BURK|nr:hypothetical protein [Paraburkholderia edwinii]QYD70076.1 hypothetical protein KZJ38_07125 [Paraburkholderia edwinii]